MKIGFIGDTHFGAGFNLGRTDIATQLNSRLLDFSKTFDSIIAKFVERKVENVIITGDIFETRHPTSAQLNVFSKCINKAISYGMKLFIVVGNHDQQRTISATTVDIYKLLSLPNINVFTEMAVHKIKDENNKDVNLIFMPYCDRRMAGSGTNAEVVAKMHGKLQTLCHGLSEPKILTGHFMIDRAITGQDGESFSMSEVILPSSMFSDFNLVVMGHVHQHAILRPKNPLIMYAGSMDKISFGEREHTKISAIFDTNDLNKPEIITTTSTRNLYTMDFDYTGGEKCHSAQITDKIILDIEKYDMRYNLKHAIVKFIAKVKENDLYYINQTRIKEYILNKKVDYLVPIQISSVSSRKLRNKNITETIDEKKAITSFINGLTEPDNTKKRLLKLATSIIEEVEGK